MANNATNINKTNNHLSHKITEHRTNTTSDDGNPGHDLGRAQKSDGVKLPPLMIQQYNMTPNTKH